MGDINIEYDDHKGIEQNISFRNGELISGKISAQRQVKLISPNWSEAEFLMSIPQIIIDEPVQQHVNLSFALSYIFEREISVSSKVLIERHTLDEKGQSRSHSSGGSFDKNSWSDGMLNVAKVIQQFYRGSCLLIEEPELHLEPRAIRRLLRILAWMATDANDIKTSSPSIQRIESFWEEFLPDYSKKHYMEGAEIKNQNTQKQLFIASHSPVLIQEFINMGDNAAIYKVKAAWMNNDCNFKLGQRPTYGYNPAEKEKGVMKMTTLFSKITRINKNAHSILLDLGCKGSDILQCNGVIWVEGPSDVIYIEKWLSMYAQENALESFECGQDYEFQMYGGALLDSLCLIKNGGDEGVEERKIIQMFSFSPNAYVVIDSDAVFKEDKDKVIDISNFFSAKRFIKDEVTRLSKEGYNLGLWYAEGDTQLKTIESYLDQKSQDSAPNSLRKKQRARKIVDTWGDEKKLSDFAPDLKMEIKKMHDLITIWQQ